MLVVNFLFFMDASIEREMEGGIGDNFQRIDRVCEEWKGRDSAIEFGVDERVKRLPLI